MKILHLANHKSTNIGNGALISGLERTLREDFRVPPQFVHEAWDDYTIPGSAKRFDRNFVDLCRDVDCLLVGAAVTLVGSRQHAAAGMRFDLPLELWDEIRCPIVFYGLSYRTWPGETYHHTDRLAKAIRYAAESDRVIFSVRNDGTKAWMAERLGIDTGSVLEVPDPALFVEADRDIKPWQLGERRPRIALAFNDEDPERRFSKRQLTRIETLASRLHPVKQSRRSIRARRLESRGRLIAQLARVAEKLTGDHDAQLILCPHHHEDFRMIADFFEVCSSRLKHQLATVNGLPQARHAGAFYNMYQNVDLTLAMRVHSMSPSIGLHTPTVAVCTQDRMLAFMEDCELSQYAIDAFDDDMETKLHTLCDGMLASPQKAVDRLTASVAKLRQRTRQFNAQVEETIANNLRAVSLHAAKREVA